MLCPLPETCPSNQVLPVLQSSRPNAPFHSLKIKCFFLKLQSDSSIWIPVTWVSEIWKQSNTTEYSNKYLANFNEHLGNSDLEDVSPHPINSHVPSSDWSSRQHQHLLVFFLPSKKIHFTIFNTFLIHRKYVATLFRNIFLKLCGYFMYL